MSRIYLSPPELVGTELSALEQALRSGWIAPVGPQVDQLEAGVARLIDMPHACATASGTAALHLALACAGITAGDEVWVSTLTFAATANAVAYTGATPVFVDCDASWNLDPKLVVGALDDAAARGRLPRAVIAVDVYGQCADLAPIAEACHRHGVLLIEDAAESLGATYRDRPAGSLGDMSILSFNGNKIITTSGGGMLLARRAEWIERARHLAVQASLPGRPYEHDAVGFNYRMSNLLAAVGLAQLPDLQRRVEARRAIRARYVERLEPHGLKFMPESPHGRGTFWLTCALVDAGRDELLRTLAERGIEARPVWRPLHLQPAYGGARLIGEGVSERLHRDGICLPSGSQLTREQQDRVVAAILER